MILALSNLCCVKMNYTKKECLTKSAMVKETCLVFCTTELWSIAIFQSNFTAEGFMSSTFKF